ncbi:MULTISPECIES: ribosome hibernation-promoting factor, HPF/YfiA family [unclassified Exiguobacterium]|uniref:ribosome hibernation-promoting factor, HPF/YfiA family n=1 Tax=unclassified Exiguobacterium TaxID=2644629 RepID=UPI0010397C01|nr:MULTISPECIES: ribosome-associated translation inhibitor RaiA [unclassified Exiguobacterium]TCI48006.1 ribosome-associated translation inhibitor RaiA [Exiguobacterium sp. SH5S32]TCI54889.1 ribosome-associated translation inhibitor RaiA [Exiguobacterium sp. SH1S4]TCI74686.1 ribosome-associated translation inhibitor RaiA [Exiguobacterium sp. SH1S1]
MIYNIRGENIEVTPAIKDYVEKKLEKLTRYFTTPTDAQTVYVNLKVYNEKQKVEVTIPMTNLLLRAEETNLDMYAAIDLVVDKLERQIRKHKTKLNRKGRAKEGGIGEYFKSLEGSEDIPAYDEDEAELELVRTKRFTLKPMDTEEAILQMDMLGHSFFVFSDAETGNTNVVYRRKDGKYGLIEPE